MWQVLCTNLPLSAISGGGADERELPDHPFALLIEDVAAIGDSPFPEIFPSVNAKLVEKRNRVAGIDRGNKGLVSGVKLLVAAAARAGVVDDVARIAVEIRIAGIDAPEIRQQRDQPAVFLINTVPRTVKHGNQRPRQDRT